MCTSSILAFNCGTSNTKSYCIFQRYCMGKKSMWVCTQNSFPSPDGGEMKKPVLLFYKSASVCKLTTVLADISMQNSFSSFGPKVPLAGDTTMEQEVAWLPMSCQTERTFSLCWFFHPVSSQNTKLFSGLGHFQAATHTVCKDWLYNSPWVIKILMPTLTPINFRCPVEAAGLRAESL